MKLTLTSYGTEYSIEKESDDITCEEYIMFFTGLLITAGFTPETVNQTLKEIADETKN